MYGEKSSPFPCVPVIQSLSLDAGDVLIPVSSPRAYMRVCVCVWCPYVKERTSHLNGNVSYTLISTLLFWFTISISYNFRKEKHLREHEHDKHTH